MIISKHEQGTTDWLQARLGRATASNFNRIMTPSQLRPSTDTYLYELAAERTTGTRQQPEWESYYMQRGKDLEPEAIKSYEFMEDVRVQRVGFCMNAEKSSYGGSPDGLVEEQGGVEIKCPSLTQHIQYCEEKKLPKAYIGQVYGLLFVTDRKWFDFMSYHPDYEDFIIRVNDSDEDYIKWRNAFKPILKDFLAKLSLIANLPEDKNKC